MAEPTRLLPKTLSCIDFIFTVQPNLAVDVVVHPSLHPNCHHQLIFCKLNLITENFPEYERLAWTANPQIIMQ